MSEEKNIQLPLSKDDINKVNASALANKHDCSQTYVSRTLKADKFPKKGKAKLIMDDAIEIIGKYKPEISAA